MSRSGWFRGQQSLLATNGASAAKRIWQRTQVLRVPAPLKRRGTALTASSAALVLASGVVIVAFASPGSHASPVSSAGRLAPTKPVQPAVALQVVSVTPVAGARGVNGASPIRVQFSAPLAVSSPMPTLSPRIAGQWTVRGDSAIFTPSVGYFENTRVTVKIPVGLAGVISAAGAKAGTGGTLASPVSQSFTTGSFSTLSSAVIPGDANAELSTAYDPPAGTFSWPGGYPWDLKDQWKAGSYNMLEDGAVRAFESVYGLTIDGQAGRSVWSDLLAAVAKGQNSPNGYTYALASKSSPETLTIWHNGHVVLRSMANTGIPVAPTADGTFPVYLRYYYQIMKGTNPDGSKYADPVYYVAYFNGGDAVHYFPRGSYGWQQSLGCVELPWDPAKKAWPYLTYGSLVTVTG